ncbi:butyrophilin subfamily 1 member A1-like isoform X1 [Fukomys damarensis]|uniref:butyrophilin subfamily 1 member A1-like isoform X1 n=1 Tax=Fukomys damarensis TaxID=885580 RepID=UPI00053FF522|nr:butyrophilin subfamily 1 member A1-like isoform X1 [Fukomys damarensis]
MLRIHGIRAFAEGVYRCPFREAFLQLRVAALGSDPHIGMEVQENGEIRLECTSVGWYPEPQVQWTTRAGEKFLSTFESRSPDQEGLFTVAASVIIRDTSLENVSCCIHNLLLGQQKEVGISTSALETFDASIVHMEIHHPSDRSALLGKPFAYYLVFKEPGCLQPM